MVLRFVIRLGATSWRGASWRRWILRPLVFELLAPPSCELAPLARLMFCMPSAIAAWSETLMPQGPSTPSVATPSRGSGGPCCDLQAARSHELAARTLTHLAPVGHTTFAGAGGLANLGELASSTWISFHAASSVGFNLYFVMLPSCHEVSASLTTSHQKLYGRGQPSFWAGEWGQRCCIKRCNRFLLGIHTHHHPRTTSRSPSRGSFGSYRGVFRHRFVVCPGYLGVDPVAPGARWGCPTPSARTPYA